MPEIRTTENTLYVSIGEWEAIEFQAQARMSYGRRRPRNMAVYVMVNDISPKLGRAIGANVPIAVALGYLQKIGLSDQIPQFVEILKAQGWSAEIPIEFSGQDTLFV